MELKDPLTLEATVGHALLLHSRAASLSHLFSLFMFDCRNGVRCAGHQILTQVPELCCTVIYCIIKVLLGKMKHLD